MSENAFLSERVAPQMIRYSQMTPLAFEGKQSLKLFFPTNQSTYNQDNRIIRIPISSGSAFLDGGNSYLKCTFKNTNATNGTSYKFSNSAHSLIDRLRVVSASGQEVEAILNYNHLHACLSDLMLSPEKRMTRLQEGYSTTANSFTAVAGADVAAVVASANTALASLLQDSKEVGCYEQVIVKDASTTIYIGIVPTGGSKQETYPIVHYG